jgi:hypothetical protein
MLNKEKVLEMRNDDPFDAKTECPSCVHYSVM